jgi:hypothetical protein
MAAPEHEKKMDEIVRKHLKPDEKLLYVTFGAQSPRSAMVVVLVLLFLFVGIKFHDLTILIR